MRVNVAALEEFAQGRGWSTPELARRLGIEYSYLFRVLNGQKGGGSKLFTGIYQLCAEEQLDFKAFVFLPSPLSANNDQAAANE